MDYFKSYYNSLIQTDTSKSTEDVSTAGDSPTPAESGPSSSLSCGALDSLACSARAPEHSTEEGQENNGQKGVWLDSLYSTALQQSSQVWGYFRNDLTEFAHTMRSDTQKAAEGVKSHLETTGPSRGLGLVQGLSRVVDTVSRTLAVHPDESGQEDNSETLLVHGGHLEPCANRYQARILSLQIDPSTYDTEPQPADDFAAFLEIFDVDARMKEVSDLLVQRNEVRGHYTRLVPSQLPHKTFWARYYFRLGVLEDEEARRDRLKNRVEKEIHEPKWDDDWDEDDKVQGEASTVKPSQSTGPTISQSSRNDAPVVVPQKTPEVSAPTLPVDESKLATSDAPVEANALLSESHVEEIVSKKPKTEDMQTVCSLVPLVAASAKVDEEEEIRMREKGDLVVIKHAGSNDTNSTGTNPANSDTNKDEWDEDFDVDITEEDIKEASNVANEMEEKADWEDWS